jgi:Ca2+-binding EF-hand superfamily protein
MFGAPLHDARASTPMFVQSRSPLLAQRPGTADSILSTSSAGGATKRARLQRLKTKMAMQADLERQWQLNNQHRPITPATLDRLSEQVSQLMDGEFPELRKEPSVDGEGAAAPVEPLELVSPTRKPAPSPTTDARVSGLRASSSAAYDAGPFRPNGASSLRDQPLGGGASRHRMPPSSPHRSLAPLDRRSMRSNSSAGSRRSSRRSAGGSSRGSVRSAVFSGCSNNTRSSLTPMTAEETLALDASMRRKMEQAGVTPTDVKRQLQFKRREGRPISRDGRCMIEDLGNTLRMLSVSVTKRELRSFTRRFRGTRDEEIEAHMVLDHLWSAPVRKAASRISIQPNLWVGGIPDASARGDTLRAAFRKFGTVATLSLQSEPFGKSWCTVTYADDTPDAAAKALQHGVTVADGEGNSISLDLKPQTLAADVDMQPSSTSPKASDRPKKVIGGNDDFERFQNLLQVTDLEDTLRKALVDASENHTAATPFMLVVLDKFEKADSQKIGRVPAAHLDTVFTAFGMGLHENAYYLLASKYNYGGDSKYVDYHRLMGALCPPELSMEDKNETSETEAFVAGKSEGAVASAVTGSFFDIAEKIKEEVKGNRSQLTSCFERLDPSKSGVLSAADIQKSLQLLRVGLSESAIRWHFGSYLVPNTDPVMIDYRRVMSEVFAPDEEFFDDLVPLHEVKHVVNTLRHTVAARWSKIVEYFRNLSSSMDEVVTKADVKKIMLMAADMELQDEQLVPIFRRLDPSMDENAKVPFSAFLDLFSPPRWQEGVRVGSTPIEDEKTDVVRLDDVQIAKEMVREAVYSRAGANHKTALTKCFKWFDRDRNGSIDYEELCLGIENAGMKLESSMLAKLMVEWDPESKGELNFEEFTTRVMGSCSQDGVTMTKESLQAFQSAPRLGAYARSWPVDKLMRAIKLKMERTWSQVEAAFRDTDPHRTNRVTREEVRTTLRRFCYDLEDKQWAAVMEDFDAAHGTHGSTHVHYDAFMQHFGRVTSTYYQNLGDETSVKQAREIIRETIESKVASGDGTLLRAFKLFDRDRSGALSYQEFAEVLRNVAMISMEPALHHKVMVSYDSDGDGTIDYAEFVQQVMGSGQNAMLDRSKSSPSSMGRMSPNGVRATGMNGAAKKVPTGVNPRWTTEKVREVLRRTFNSQPGRIRRALNSCDTRRSGKITIEQLHELLQTFNLGMTQGQFGELLGHFDVDNGQISISDFCSYYVEQQAEVFELTPTVVTDMPVADVAKLMQTKLAERTGSGANELRRSFKFFDRDSSGTIDYLEFQEAIKSLLNIYLSEDLSKKVLCHFDGDGNGEIDYQEFVQLVMKSNQEDSTSLVTNAGIASQQRGYISEHERRALRSRIVQQWKGLLTAFREADVHKSGVLHSRCTKSSCH